MDNLRNRIIKAVTILFLIIFSNEFSNAQTIDGAITNRPRITNVDKSEPTRVSKPQAIRVISKTVYKTKEVTKFVNPTGLYVETLANADVSLESLPPAKKFKKTVRADEGSSAFENLPPGTYKLSVSSEGYQPQETQIKVIRNQIAVETVVLNKVIYDFSIRTNIETGEVRFAPAKIIGQNADGTLKTQETGGYCVAPIQEYKAVIKELAEGTYNINVSASDAPEYQPELAVIKIPEDIPDLKNDKSADDKMFRINLVNTQSTETFNQILTRDAWILPKNWVIDAQGMKADGSGTALPKSTDYRFYKDFEMRATARLLDNSSIGFVVRARDENNFYLIQITGANSGSPYFINGYLVKEGKPELVVSNPAPFLNKIINDQKYFGVVIKAKEKTFEVFVEEIATGSSYPLGKVIFKDNDFAIGAVGVGVLEKSNFEVGLFSVCNFYCK